MTTEINKELIIASNLFQKNRSEMLKNKNQTKANLQSDFLK